MTRTPKVQAAVDSLRSQGHAVRYYGAHGKTCVQIDGWMLASFKEMEELADGVYSLEELEELNAKRRAEEEGRRRPKK